MRALEGCKEASIQACWRRSRGKGASIRPDTRVWLSTTDGPNLARICGESPRTWPQLWRRDGYRPAGEIAGQPVLVIELELSDFVGSDGRVLGLVFWVTFSFSTRFVVSSTIGLKTSASVDACFLLCFALLRDSTTRLAMFSRRNGSIFTALVDC